MGTSRLPSGYDLRPLRADDAPEVAAAYERNRAHLAPWDPARPAWFYTEEGQRDAIASQLARVAAGSGAGWVLTSGGRVVGRVNLTNIVHGVLCSGSVGYWVDQEHLRRGLALAALEHACDAALDLGLHRVEAGTMVPNEASQRVLLRAGFTRIGTAPSYLYLAGAWQDHVLFQRLLHDDPP